jgi:hypothetical protein
MSMNDAKPDIKKNSERRSSESERITALMKPELRREKTAKTLISRSGAILVFTITFSQSVIKPENTALLASDWSWLGFICSLVCCLASLWSSMGLQSLPVVIKAKESEVEECLRVGI